MLQPLSSEFLPLGDKVLLRIPPVDHQPAGTAIIQVESRWTPNIWCEVVDIGPGRVSDTGAFIVTTINPGQWILKRRELGIPVPHPTDELLVIREGDVLAVSDIRLVDTTGTPHVRPE